MAPIKKRASMRSRAATSKTPSKPSASASTDDSISAADVSALRLKKQDKRHLKHAALMHKVRDASVSKSSSGQKRRRPAKKMQAADSLGGLRDALPEAEGEDEEWEGLSEDGDEGMAVDAAATGKKKRRRDGEGKIKMRSLQHRPGAMKRKQVLERREQERFRQNLAQLAANEGGGKKTQKDGGRGGDEAGGQAGKWAALRAFIGGTMEREKAFRTA